MNAELPLQPQKPKREPRGIPFPVALIALFVLALLVVAGFGGMWYYLQNDKLKIQRQLDKAEADKTRAELATKKAAEEGKLTQARNRQEEVLAQARLATNVLTRLLAETDQASNEAAGLKTNDPGRGVAIHPDLIKQSRRFYESELREMAAREEIVTRLEGARRIEQQLLTASGTAYEPAADLKVTAQNSTAWGEQALQKTRQIRQTLATLVQESKIKVTTATVTPTSPTLEAAIAQLNDEETILRQRLLAATTADAKAQAAKIEAEADGKRIIAEAERKRDEILAKAKEETDKLARDLALREAQGKAEDTKTHVAVQTAQDEARKVELRKKAADPAIRAKLAPFTTPGYAQINTLGSDLKPLSYSGLQNCGALAPDVRGLTRLLTVASTSADKVRPRWKMNPQLFVRHPDEIEKVKEAQQLLIDLGPVLVEMGLLQP
jgi:hypothetical protein